MGAGGEEVGSQELTGVRSWELGRCIGASRLLFGFPANCAPERHSSARGLAHSPGLLTGTAEANSPGAREALLGGGCVGMCQEALFLESWREG